MRSRKSLRGSLTAATLSTRPGWVVPERSKRGRPIRIPLRRSVPPRRRTAVLIVSTSQNSSQGPMSSSGQRPVGRKGCAPNRSDINLSSEPFPQVRADRASIRTADSPRAATSQVGADVEDLDDAVIASTPQDKVVIGSSPNDEAEHRRLLVTPTAVRRVVLASDKSSKLRAQIAVQQLGLRVGLQAQQFGASVFRDPEHTTSLSPTCDRCDDGTTGTQMSAIHLEHAVQCRP